MADHTPTPWHADPDNRDGMAWNVLIVERDNPNNQICFMTSDVRSEANAAFIVKAVNAHEGLIAALKEIAFYDDFLDAQTAKNMMAVAREALRQAGGSK